MALKIILKDGYQNYEHALEFLNLKTLSDRRSDLCLRFAKKCLKVEKTKDMFPLNESNKQEDLRFKEKYIVQHASTGRLYDSALPQMQRALNLDAALNQNKWKMTINPDGFEVVETDHTETAYQIYQI